MMVRAERLVQRFAQLAEIGRNEDGTYNRLAYGAEEHAARGLLMSWADAAGLASRLDSAGNVHVSCRPLGPGYRRVMTGSHLDTVPGGGAWDGALGVVAGLEALEVLRDDPGGLGELLEVVGFAAEESPRFQQAAYRFGSRAMVGDVTAEMTEKLVDKAGVSLGEAMRSLGLDPGALAGCVVDGEDIEAFVELHIEQGALMRDGGDPVASVTCITGSTRLRVTVGGRADHSGAARMKDRKDALAAACEIVLAAEQIGLGDPTGNLVTTVGSLTVRPGAVSVVPGEVELFVDIRSVDAQILADAELALSEAMAKVGQARGVSVTSELVRRVAPITLDPGLCKVIRESSEACGYGRLTVPSHAGHDAGTMAGITRVGMVFVRNRSGRSHCPEESIDWDDALAGAEVLAHTLVRLCKELAQQRTWRSGGGTA